MKRQLLTLILVFLLLGKSFAQDYEILQQSEKGIPTAIKFGATSGINHENFCDRLKQVFNLKQDDKFVLIKTTPDKKGFIHYKYNQQYKGITVYGVQYIIEEKDGQAISAIGKFFPNLNIDITPTIPKDDAIKKATKYLGLTKYRWEDKKGEDAYRAKTRNPKASHYPKPELVIAPRNGNYKKAEFMLCWKFNVLGATLDKAWTIFVDAKTGEIINKITLVNDADVAASGATYYNGTRNFTAHYSPSLSSNLLLETNTRGPLASQEIYTLDANHDSLPNEGGDVWSSYQFIGSPTTNFSNDAVANSVHWGMENTYDFYYNLFGRNSFDDNGTYIYNLVHYKVDLNNAFWSGADTLMCYGDGDGIDLDYVVGLDVEGHELTHGVTQFSAGLVYQYESGALNESFSDIMGTGVEAYTLGANSNWTIGEGVELQSPFYLRNMANPNSDSDPDPDTYAGLHWVDQVGCVPDADLNDLCGVHTNSGVQNFWFYLLAAGGAGTNDIGQSYSVIGIGITDAIKIAYRNLTLKLNSTSDYSDARQGSILSADDLFGVNSQQEQSVINAWCAVGVGNCSGLSIKQLSNKLDYEIYPNPAKNKISIFNNHLSEKLTLSISNTLGQIIKLEIIPSNNGIIDIETTDLKNGIYYLNLSSKNESKTEIESKNLSEN